MKIDFTKYESEFESAMINNPYRQCGMFDSEIFAVFSYFRELNCDLFVESGICEGYSTNSFLKLLNVEYHGVDIRNVPCFEVLSKEFSNFTSYHGDSFKILPTIIEKNPDRNVFVMIDGPKEGHATDLKNKLLKRFPQIRAAAIHDMVVPCTDTTFCSVTDPEFNNSYYKKYNVQQSVVRDTVEFEKTYCEHFPEGPGVSIYTR